MIRFRWRLAAALDRIPGQLCSDIVDRLRNRHRPTHRRDASKTRWRIAHLDRFPGQCWADLADWAGRNRRGNPWQPVTRTCIGDINRVACYCGKLRNPNTRNDKAGDLR